MRYTLIFTIFLILSGCYTTKLIDSWSQDNWDSRPYQNIGVILFSPNVSAKATVESGVSESLRAKGIKAMATFDIFPFAGNVDAAKKIQERSEEEVRDYVRKRVNKFELDGLLIISVLDERKERRYRQGSYVGLGMPMYGQTFHGYYSYMYATVGQPGYYTTSSTYLVESNFYDVETEKLAWSGHTKTSNPRSLESESVLFGDILAKALLKEGIVKP